MAEAKLGYTMNPVVMAELPDTSKGMEKILKVTAKSLIKMDAASTLIFEGKSEEKQVTLIDKGLLNALDLLTSIDLCNIVNAAASKIPGALERLNDSLSDKNSISNYEKEGTALTDYLSKLSPVQKNKFLLQRRAYRIKKPIEEFEKNYTDVNNPDTKNNLFILTQNLTGLLEDFKKTILDDPDTKELASYFPPINKAYNYFDDAMAFFDKYTDYRQIEDKNFAKLLKLVQTIKKYCTIILALNDPAALLQVIGGNTTEKISRDAQAQIAKIQSFINPVKISSTLRSINKTCESVIRVCKQAMNFIKLGQVVIRIATLLVSIFKKIVAFFKYGLAIPNIFTAVNITNVTSDALKELQGEKRGVDYFVDRLNQISVLMGMLFNFINKLVGYVQQIIDKLKVMILNLSVCSPNKDLSNTLRDLEEVQKEMKSYIATVENNKKSTDRNNKIGDFTISIITEEVVDEAFTRKRRYGVALNNKGVVIAQSTPTFASDDTIITNEVKLLLSSRGLVKSQVANFSPVEEQAITDANDYLLDQDINWDSVESYEPSLDDPDNENEDTGLGLNAFINKLKGGKKLRRNMKKQMAKNTASLSKDMKTTDPSGKYSNKPMPGTSLADKLGGNSTSETSSPNESGSSTQTTTQNNQSINYQARIYTKNKRGNPGIFVTKVTISATSEDNARKSVEKKYPDSRYVIFIAK